MRTSEVTKDRSPLAGPLVASHDGWITSLLMVTLEQHDVSATSGNRSDVRARHRALHRFPSQCRYGRRHSQAPRSESARGGDGLRAARRTTRSRHGARDRQSPSAGRPPQLELQPAGVTDPTQAHERRPRNRPFDPGSPTPDCLPDSSWQRSSQHRRTHAAHPPRTPAPRVFSPRSCNIELPAVAAQVQPSVVEIMTSDKQVSGVVFDAMGNIVTNAHVVRTRHRRCSQIRPPCRSVRSCSQSAIRSDSQARSPRAS